MSKNNMGKVLAFLAGAGAAAAAIAYFVRYKAFNKELEKDFHAFEDEELDDGDEEDPLEDLNNPSHRNYVSLSSSKDEFKAASHCLPGGHQRLAQPPAPLKTFSKILQQF